MTTVPPSDDRTVTPEAATNVIPPSTAADQNQTFSIMLQMQQQQLAMQQQITQLISNMNPVAHHTPLNNDQNPQRCKPTRPTIEADCTDNKWVIFKDAWTRFKQMARLNNVTEIRNELRSSCSTAVNELLFNFVGPDNLNEATEEELLSHIKSVAVKAVHPEVYRQQFFRLKQSDGESITHFVSRLKSQAMLCDFTQKCERGQCETSYSSNMITSQIIAGLYNQSHQSKVLSEVSSLKTLPQLVERLLTLEATAQAASHFQPGSSVCPVKSDYQKNKMSDTRQTDIRNTPAQKCYGCGRNRHEQGRKQCPAQGKKCNKCGKSDHFASVCRSSSSSNAAISNNIEQEDTSFIASVTDKPPL